MTQSFIPSVHRGYNLREADHNYKDKIKSLASNMEAMEIAKAMGVHVSEVNKTPELTGFFFKYYSNLYIIIIYTIWRSHPPTPH